MNFISKEKLVNECSNWAGDITGYWITLDSPRKSTRERLEEQIGLWSHRINEYCYGRKYKHKKANLKIVGGIEQCPLTGRWHAHLVVGHDEQCTRRFAEISTESRNIWYGVTQAKGSIFGGLVDVQHAVDVAHLLDYAFKGSNKSQRENDLNVVIA